MTKMRLSYKIRVDMSLSLQYLMLISNMSPNHLFWTYNGSNPTPPVIMVEPFHHLYQVFSYVHGYSKRTILNSRIITEMRLSYKFSCDMSLTLWDHMFKLSMSPNHVQQIRLWWYKQWTFHHCR